MLRAHGLYGFRSFLFTTSSLTLSGLCAQPNLWLCVALTSAALRSGRGGTMQRLRPMPSVGCLALRRVRVAGPGKPARGLARSRSTYFPRPLDFGRCLLWVSRPDLSGGRRGAPSRVVPSSPVGRSDGRGYGSVCWSCVIGSCACGVPLRRRSAAR